MRYVLLLLPALLLAGCESGSQRYSLSGDESADIQKARAYEYSDTMTPPSHAHGDPAMSSPQVNDD